MPCRSWSFNPSINTFFYRICQVNPKFDPWSVPHSCGETCERGLDPDCGHSCLLLCHPGNLVLRFYVFIDKNKVANLIFINILKWSKYMWNSKAFYIIGLMGLWDNRNRKRKVIWCSPPFNKSVQTNIGEQFLNLVQKHFPEENKFHQIFNKNNVKVSYSCSQNMANIIRKHNNKVLNTDPDKTQSNTCNCREKDQCPLENNCLSPSIVYNAHITTDESTQEKNYIGLTSKDTTLFALFFLPLLHVYVVRHG